MKIVNQEFKSIIENEVFNISNHISNIIYDFDGVSFIFNDKKLVDMLALEFARDVKTIYILIGDSKFLTVIFEKSREEIFIRDNAMFVEMPELITYDLFLSDKEETAIEKTVNEYHLVTKI